MKDTRWPKCRRKEGHEISAILPEDDKHPVMLFCSVCGMSNRYAIDLPVPLDDLPADAIARMARPAKTIRPSVDHR